MNKELLKKAQGALAIEDIYLHECRTTVYPGFDPKLPSPTLSMQFRMKTKNVSGYEIEKDNGEKMDIVRFDVETGLRIVSPEITKIDEETTKPEDLTKHIKAEITASFIAEYRLLNKEIGEPEQRQALEEFGKYNVGYHIWPYWREFVQTMCARMLLPNIVLPMYRVVDPEAKKREVSSIPVENVSEQEKTNE